MDLALGKHVLKLQASSNTRGYFGSNLHHVGLNFYGNLEITLITGLENFEGSLILTVITGLGYLKETWYFML